MAMRTTAGPLDRTQGAGDGGRLAHLGAGGGLLTAGRFSHAQRLRAMSHDLLGATVAGVVLSVSPTIGRGERSVQLARSFRLGRMDQGMGG